MVVLSTFIAVVGRPRSSFFLLRSTPTAAAWMYSRALERELFPFRSHRLGPPESIRYAAMAAAYPESMFTAVIPLAQELTADSSDARPENAAP